MYVDYLYNFFLFFSPLKKYELFAGIHALFAQSPIVICPVCGKNLIMRYINSRVILTFPKKLLNMLL